MKMIRFAHIWSERSQLPVPGAVAPVGAHRIVFSAAPGGSNDGFRPSYINEI